MADSPVPAAPIGVFDSGVGGLSVLRALRARLPAETFAYVADSGHAPYGDRSPEFVERRVTEIARFLTGRKAKAMVIACNTASVMVAAKLRNMHVVPIVAMEPAIKPAALATRSKVVLVLATASTIRSEAVARLCSAHAKGIRILLQACPGLADRVERAEFGSTATRRLLREYILPGLAEGADTIVLGCTHYAFLATEIAAIAGPLVTIVEPSDAIARQLARVLPTAAPSSRPGATTTRFYTSGPAVQLSSFLAAIGEPFERVCEMTGFTEIGHRSVAVCGTAVPANRPS
jgi:glutamate racemase